jgi:hypothetical protein
MLRNPNNDHTRSMAMYANASRPKQRCVTVRVVLVGVLWLVLFGLPGLLLAQERGARSQLEALMETPEEAASLPLTTAQEQARQLATVLVATQGSAATTARRTPLGVVTDQALQPGTRVILPLFDLGDIEVRLVSGEQTMASPVADDGETEAEDARRPLFIPASKSAFAVEMLVK